MSFRFKDSMRLKKRYHVTLDSKFLKGLIGLKRTIKNGNKVKLDEVFLNKLDGEKAIIRVREDIDETDESQVIIRLEKTGNEIILDSISDYGLEELGLEKYE